MINNMTLISLIKRHSVISYERNKLGRRLRKKIKPISDKLNSGCQPGVKIFLSPVTIETSHRSLLKISNIKNFYEKFAKQDFKTLAAQIGISKKEIKTYNSWVKECVGWRRMKKEAHRYYIAIQVIAKELGYKEVRFGDVKEWGPVGDEYTIHVDRSIPKFLVKKDNSTVPVQDFIDDSLIEHILG